MNASHVCMTLVFSLLIASSLFEQAAADVFNTEQKGLLKDLAKGAGGVFQQIIATRGSIRTAEVQAQAQATAAAAAAAAARPPLPQNLVPVNPGPALQAPQFRQGPFQGPVAQFQPVGAGGPYRPPYQGPYQGPYRGQGQYQGYNGYPGQQGYPQQGPVPPAAVPFQGGTQGNPVIQGNQGNQGNQVNQVNRGVPNGPDACSATETSPQAVERCINAVRTNPNAFVGQFPCSITGLVPRKPLNTDFALAKAAYAHSQDLSRMGTVGHVGSDGSDLRTRVQVRAGFPNASIGENAAGGQENAREVVFAWMCSEGHRNNVMSCNYDSFGTGIVQGSWPYWVQNFGCRSGSCTC